SLTLIARPPLGLEPVPSIPTHLPPRTARFLTELLRRRAYKAANLLSISELFPAFPAGAINWPSVRNRGARFAQLNCLCGRAAAKTKSYVKSRLDVASTWAAPAVYQLHNYTSSGN